MVVHIPENQPTTDPVFLPPEPLAPTLSPQPAMRSPVTLALSFYRLYPSNAYMTTPQQGLLCHHLICAGTSLGWCQVEQFLGKTHQQ